jgi:hypothetical protein
MIIFYYINTLNIVSIATPTILGGDKDGEEWPEKAQGYLTDG